MIYTFFEEVHRRRVREIGSTYALVTRMMQWHALPESSCVTSVEMLGAQSPLVP